MKKIIFIVILGCITSCTDNLPKYSCVYYSMTKVSQVNKYQLAFL